MEKPNEAKVVPAKADDGEDETNWPAPVVLHRIVSEREQEREQERRNVAVSALIRLVATPLLCLSMLAAMFRNLFRGLHRDLLVYPWEFMSEGNLTALGLQLAFQVWVGACFAILYGSALTVAAPIMCLIGIPWEKILGILAKHRMERPLAARLIARLPVWGSENTKLSTWPSHVPEPRVAALLL